MVALNLLVPTKKRSFIFYDRAAILLDPDEMAAQRVRISVEIFATPVSRSLNLKYPYSKEFYGYAQGFFTGILTHEFPINYSTQYIWDYWNEHATIASQLASVLARIRQFLLASIQVQTALANNIEPILGDLMDASFDIIEELTNGLTFDNVPDGTPVGIGDRILNTFVHPFDLIRFKFVFGTVFLVDIESWNLVDTTGSFSPPPWPEELPYNPANPNDSPPETTPGGADPENPYGAIPPDSSPRDPRLDPNEFSNAPDPEPPLGTVDLQGWQIPAIPGQQTAGFAVGCPAASLADSVPPLAGVQNEINLGVFPISQDSAGRVSGDEVLAAFPGFIFGDNFFGANADCGVTGTF